jgi:hypothetical protein
MNEDTRDDHRRAVDLWAHLVRSVKGGATSRSSRGLLGFA